MKKTNKLFGKKIKEFKEETFKMSLQFSIDNILSEKIAPPAIDPLSVPKIPSSGTIGPYMSLAAAAAAASYPPNNLAACYSYLNPYVMSSSGMYSSTSKCKFYKKKLFYRQN